MDDSPILSGVGDVKRGSRHLGKIPYEVEVSIENGQASIVRFARMPPVRSGDTLHLTLEDGRMLDCQLLDAAPFCAVVGEGPYDDRRERQR